MSSDTWTPHTPPHLSAHLCFLLLQHYSLQLPRQNKTMQTHCGPTSCSSGAWCQRLCIRTPNVKTRTLCQRCEIFSLLTNPTIIFSLNWFSSYQSEFSPTVHINNCWHQQHWHHFLWQHQHLRYTLYTYFRFYLRWKNCTYNRSYSTGMYRMTLLNKCDLIIIL